MAIAEELASRWERTRALMSALDIDLVIAFDLSRDEVMLSYQRWFTTFVPIGFPAAVLLPREGPATLIAPMIGKPATDYYAEHRIPIELVPGFSLPMLVDAIARLAPRRLGIVETLAFPAALATALTDRLPGLEIVDISAPMLNVRLRKSPFELERIRRSCAIADAVWEQVVEVFRIGRRSYEVLADVDHMVRMKGAEGGFHLILPLPFSGMPMQVLADPLVIAPGMRFLMEISPRFDGYYSQLTIPVTSCRDDTAVHDAHGVIVEAKAMAEPLMVPGADLSAISGSVAAFLGERGHAMAGPSLGHFCGLGLEEPRHVASAPFILEEDMTLIFHPVLADPRFRSLMRAETYVITPTGAEKLNRYAGGVLEIA